MKTYLFVLTFMISMVVVAQEDVEQRFILNLIKDTIQSKTLGLPFGKEQCLFINSFRAENEIESISEFGILDYYYGYNIKHDKVDSIINYGTVQSLLEFFIGVDTVVEMISTENVFGYSISDLYRQNNDYLLAIAYHTKNMGAIHVLTFHYHCDKLLIYRFETADEYWSR